MKSFKMCVISDRTVFQLFNQYFNYLRKIGEDSLRVRYRLNKIVSSLMHYAGILRMFVPQWFFPCLLFLPLQKYIQGNNCSRAKKDTFLSEFSPLRRKTYMKMAKQFLHIMEILKNKLNKTVYIHILYFLVLCDR